PETVPGLPDGAIRFCFDPSGTRVAYGKRDGKVGVLKLTDSNKRGVHTIGVTQVMAEKNASGTATAVDWSFVFSGDYLYFVQIIDPFRTKITGWVDLKTLQVHLMAPPYKDSLPDWAFAVGTCLDPQSAEAICIVGMSRACQFAKPG